MSDYSSILNLTGQDLGFIGNPANYPAAPDPLPAPYVNHSIIDYLKAIGKVSSNAAAGHHMKHILMPLIIGDEAARHYIIDSENANDNLMMLGFLRNANGKVMPFNGYAVQPIVEMLAMLPLSPAQIAAPETPGNGSQQRLNEWIAGLHAIPIGTTITLRLLESQLFSDYYYHNDPVRSSRYVLAALVGLTKQMKEIDLIDSGVDPEPPGGPIVTPPSSIIVIDPPNWQYPVPPWSTPGVKHSPPANSIWRREGILVNQAWGAQGVSVNGEMYDVDWEHNINVANVFATTRSPAHVNMLPAEYNLGVWDIREEHLGRIWTTTSYGEMGLGDLNPKTIVQEVGNDLVMYRALKSTTHGAAKFYLIPEPIERGRPIYEFCGPPTGLVPRFDNIVTHQQFHRYIPDILKIYDRQEISFTNDHDRSLNFLYEVTYRYALFGTGQFIFYVNMEPVEDVYGPLPWRQGGPHKVELYTEGIGSFPTFLVYYRNVGISDPGPHFEMDLLRVFGYVPIYADFAEYEPPKADTEPIEINILHGFKVFQQTSYIGTQMSIKLRFQDADIYQDFIRNADKVHVVYDNLGIPYRGVVVLGEVDKISDSMYELDITFKAPNKLGVGWV